MQQKILFAAKLVLCVFLSGSCNKDDGPDNTVSPKFTFTYNGQVYNDVSNGALMRDAASRVEGISIINPMIFGGQIFFRRVGCAYLQPTGTQIILSGPPGSCELRNDNGSAIDSSQVYLYQAGNFSLSYTDCVSKTDPVTNLKYEECTVTGSFQLTLGNNNNATIHITNGSLAFLKVRR